MQSPIDSPHIMLVTTGGKWKSLSIQILKTSGVKYIKNYVIFLSGKILGFRDQIEQNSVLMLILTKYK